jgi:hypothetical protein
MFNLISACWAVFRDGAPEVRYVVDGDNLRELQEGHAEVKRLRSRIDEIMGIEPALELQPDLAGASFWESQVNKAASREQASWAHNQMLDCLYPSLKEDYQALRQQRRADAEAAASAETRKREQAASEAARQRLAAAAADRL